MLRTGKSIISRRRVMVGRRESVDKESSNYVPSNYVFHRVVVTLSSSSSKLLGKSRKLDGKLLIKDVDQRSTIAQLFPFFLAEGLVLDHAGVKLLQDLFEHHLTKRLSVFLKFKAKRFQHEVFTGVAFGRDFF